MKIQNKKELLVTINFFANCYQNSSAYFDAFKSLGKQFQTERIELGFQEEVLKATLISYADKSEQNKNNKKFQYKLKQKTFITDLLEFTKKVCLVHIKNALPAVEEINGFKQLKNIGINPTAIKAAYLNEMGYNSGSPGIHSVAERFNDYLIRRKKKQIKPLDIDVFHKVAERLIESAEENLEKLLTQLNPK